MKTYMKKITNVKEYIEKRIDWLEKTKNKENELDNSIRIKELETMLFTLEL